jgi:HAD superfamily hydrolase (TIGR01509 family)
MGQIKGFFFDQDGVIIDTEKDGHRVAFNRTFKDFGFDFEWSVEDYHGLLQVAGGKERMRHYLHTAGFDKRVDSSEEDDLIKKMHQHKTQLFVRLLESNDLPLRPGIHRMMREINRLGLTLGVCTTSSQHSAQAVTHIMLNDIRFDVVLAGDVVSKKKPDPEIYLLALERTGLRPKEAIVIEDSHNGIAAAKAAGMYVVATTNYYTEKEDLSQADIVVTCLGDPEGERGELRAGGEDLDYEGILTAGQLIGYFSS